MTLKLKLPNVLLRFIKPVLFWDWYDFGLVLKVNKQSDLSSYYFAIDIQLGWFNIWAQCWRR